MLMSMIFLKPSSQLMIFPMIGCFNMVRFLKLSLTSKMKNHSVFLVSAVCHHGGAGTTAAGLLAGKPTITVPFFGDQFFWAHVVENSGVGPPPLPGKQLTVEKLVEAFKFVHRPDVQQAAKRVQDSIAHEDGCEAAVRAFHTHLPLSEMRSDLEPTFPACFRLDEFDLQVSRPVAQVLLSCGVVNESQFRYHSTKQWRSEQKHTR